MEMGICSHVGCVREINQDNFGYSLQSPIFIAVADGMGGHKAGEVASALAIEMVEEKLLKTSHVNISDVFTSANEKIINHASLHDKMCSGMGTTLSLGVLWQERLHIGHIGDSRIYLIRDGEIDLLTKDHSLVAELVEKGEIKPEQAENHPQRHIITRALGSDLQVLVDESETMILSQDILVFCTDGLTNLVNNQEIKETLLSTANLQDGAECLVDLANQRGGYDNITIVCGLVEACDIEKR